MKVAIFTDTFLPDVNGVARTLGKWVRYLESQGATCRVFAPQSEGGAGTDYNNTMVERFYSIPFLLYPECKLAIPNPITIKKTLMEFKPDIIHCATPFNLGLYGLHYAKKHKIPVVASYHTHFDQYLQYYKIQWVEGMLWRYLGWFHQTCRRIYVPSMSTLHYLEERGFHNLEVWSRGVDVSRFHPDVDRQAVLENAGADPDKFTMLYVGRLAPEKSVDVLIDAYNRLPDRIREQSQIILAGDGPLFKELTETYKDRADMKFLGFVQGQELSNLYAASDLFVFPSATETFGNVVLESMASGTPVIGAAAGGVQDTVRHMQTGWLCPVGDAEAFAGAIESLFDNPGLRSSMAKAGREYSLLQSWDSIFSRLLDSYRQVLPVTREMSKPELAAAK
ncbi:glycosyltransferase family 4 protein [Gorillibacterium sp. sgz5001074]|uniref:glycosyltransferase family 4 protein n=1 Tax=Gorillibacterium sp. sgz5001074 TaxID=3446695 RepID=UPI003F674A69